MYCWYLFLIMIVLGSSCSQLSPKEQQLRDAINQELQLGTTQVVQLGDTIMTYEELRQSYGYISIVYLQNGCAPCYPKFMEWQEKMESMELPPDYTVLFVIRGERYNQFIEEVTAYARGNSGVDTVEHNFPVAMDPDFDFLSSNHTIPRWIIDRSVLIDSQSRIRMVGAPWATPGMTELFQRICSEGKDD
jgi:hypothetical protein